MGGRGLGEGLDSLARVGYNSAMIATPWIANEFFSIGTPVQAPKTYGGFVWLAAEAKCLKCGRGHTQALRIHKVMLPSFLSDVIIHKDMPSDEKIAASFSLKVAENGVGCWRTCRPCKHNKKCFCIGECTCERSAQCVCPKGCGNQGIWPCNCGRMFAQPGGKHNHGCPTGLVKRVSSFEVAEMRARMIGPRRRRAA